MPDRDVLRILDANVNRAREALRVVEEHARFRLASGRLTAAVKSLRHDLVAATAGLPRPDLLAARDAASDVGAALTTPSEVERADAEAVLTAALKRVQEALRVIEEYGKIIDPGVGAGIERLRFRAYDLERELAAAAPRARFAAARLYVLVTEAQCRRGWLEVVEGAIAGGADVIQLREKHLTDREYLSRAEQAREVCSRRGALFAVNDRLDAAQMVRADAVHLGQEDLPAERARRLVGPGMAIGVSTHTIGQARAAVAEGADYLGVGPIFPTATKPQEPVAGLDFARQAAAEIEVPCFALGGITPEDLGQVLAAGMRRIAVSASVIASDDPESAARALRQALPD